LKPKVRSSAKAVVRAWGKAVGEARRGRKQRSALCHIAETAHAPHGA
jgi:hypothetical protein